MAVFPEGTTFRGAADYPGGNDGYVILTFTLDNTATTPISTLTPLEIANAISAAAQAKGYPKIVFSGPPMPVEVNP
ncbi:MULTISPECIES: hypothetical protein [Streptomyces]|uniref:Uncharacterized protein n=1 Tax=Streptomyces tsukubensis (strain DSM 42081 / NBRC 108919 / NRRL 18488 / 9993) TaxID=1114943 RepID=I2N3W8_STRT9|nr:MULTISPECIES: hypothetical protein [Streptomyces]AZK95772.1 hypothetical protein B7R87_19340 [Streptomyces tsukubensis]EIF91715.1 hypothetical protein [Streptomyces tsukubensis NRRL18488]MYS65660.1 hypothetical protein [Streptomyces sp. SID5473]QKM68202.1 hypothetical protein STSU_014450 [Streptomyces tsukubensis NRRL18488]TAI44604.1 hypothetical protein EWI31_14230 [Streptomyces tsukubensis]